MENEIKVEKDVAVQEVQDFVKKFDSKEKKDWQIEQEYPDVLDAVQKGRLVFDSKGVPSLELSEPVFAENGEVALTKVDFKTRIKPSTLSDITKGLDIAKNQYEYSLRCMAYLTGLPKAMFDKLSKVDFKTVEQISSVFM